MPETKAVKPPDPEVVELLVDHVPPLAVLALLIVGGLIGAALLYVAINNVVVEDVTDA